VVIGLIVDDHSCDVAVEEAAGAGEEVVSPGAGVVPAVADFADQADDGFDVVEGEIAGHVVSLPWSVQFTGEVQLFSDFLFLCLTLTLRHAGQCIFWGKNDGLHGQTSG
jgi:hypothetical protein